MQGMSQLASHLPESDRATRPPQFGLRTMLIGMTAVSAVFGVFVAVGPMWSAMLALTFSLIGLHVAGNALGTQLSERPHAVSNELPRLSTGEPVESVAIPRFVPAKSLQANTSIERRWWIGALIGAVLGAIIGGLLIANLVGNKLTLAGLLLGISSSSVLGGFLFFMAISVWTVARTALREAIETLDEDCRMEASHPQPQALE